jgi:archaemetzincin
MTAQGAIVLEWIGEGALDARLLDRAREEVEIAFGLPTYVRTVHAPPADTLDARRRQRSSTKILRWILERVPSGPLRVVGITDADLFIPVLTFVLGEARLGGRVAVVSTARLGESPVPRPARAGLCARRLAKECLHELGHTFGLVHCPDLGCVMSRSNSIVDVDRKRAGFCRDCRQHLRLFLREGDRD